MQWLWWEQAQPASPWDNMETDAVLFADIRDGRRPLSIVRVYRWDRPSVTIGRLQQEDDVRVRYPDLPIVRRPTGGRAVVHGDDLTLSVITRDEWLPAQEKRSVMSSYRQILSGVIAALDSAGLETDLGQGNERAPSARSIDCFASTASCDVAERGTGRKVLGSAQRREHGAILQQMTLASDLVIDHNVFVRSLKARLMEPLGIDSWADFVDSESVLCYTEEEGPQGLLRRHVAHGA
ncbi:hypothetical protein CCAX7_44400 [Capsulimonas corticalis]|uniref:Uncharacterized protein n=1 Tax=Capsulimonas corticalis TaxID=2219043 RepID=A0A402CX60_9BACT|nr:lipoate--protein ligase family protein [Capsulimonas corticalis]BDI32389.1 hypothetical protein CCAX7_44400 [Capsulimonas corticalis]